jgi:DNA-binding HxlR family transcriptional regulator
VKLQSLLDDPTVKILRYVSQKQELRYIEIQDNVNLSRSTINVAIHELEGLRLISRRITQTKPIQVYYSITPKGKEIVACFEKLRGLIHS